MSLNRHLGPTCWAVRWCFCAVTFFAVLAVVRPALAEMQTRALGFKVSSGRLHPFFDLDTHLVYNPGRVPSAEVVDVYFAFRPGFDFKLPSDTFEIDVDLNGEYQQYLGLQTSTSRGLSSLMGELGASALINKKGSFAVTVRDSLRRASDPAGGNAGRFQHTSNEISFRGDIKPGGGALIIQPGYRFFLDFYDANKNTGTLFQSGDLNHLQHMASLTISWKFLPKTAFFIDSDFSFTSYPSTTNSQGSIALLRVSGGARSAVTQRISTTLQGGYGQSFAASPQNFLSAVVQADVAYHLTETSRIRGGYRRSVSPTSLFVYYGRDYGFLNYNQAFAGFIQAEAEIGYELQAFGPNIIDGTTGRRDGLLTAHLAVQLQIFEFLVITIGDDLDLRHSNYTSAQGTASGYVMNDFFIRVKGRY